MKSFFEMVHDWQFAMMLTVAFMISGFDLAYGTKIIGAVFLIILMSLIALNIWKTRKH